MKQLTKSSPLERMIQQQIVERGIRDPRILDAMRTVPREKFFPGESKAEAYADRTASIGHGQTISTPHIVALMTARLDVGPGHKVLELGTGSGYQTAVLAKLAGQVYSIERVKPLLDAAWERLMDLGLRNTHFRYGDGTLGWPEEAPFDRILIAAGAPQLPRELLLGQLKDGGLAVLPIGPADDQMLIEVRRAGTELAVTDICPCRFVKLIGQEGWSEKE
ncbi:MAG TPA: protein-L-isoaspartate(D-aspartate) O-methyltransferase [Tepidisphaeraceae bacterium]